MAGVGDEKIKSFDLLNVVNVDGKVEDVVERTPNPRLCSQILSLQDQRSQVKCYARRSNTRGVPRLNDVLAPFLTAVGE